MTARKSQPTEPVTSSPSGRFAPDLTVLPTHPVRVRDRRSMAGGERQEATAVLEGTVLTVVARGVPLRQEWTRAARRELDRLRRHTTDPIRLLRVEILGTAHHRLGGFEVQVALEVADQHLALSHQGPRAIPLVTRLGVALRRALQEHAAEREGGEPTHARHVRHGRVKFCLVAEGYGFITADDGEDVYFHVHALKDQPMAAFVAGTRVRFVVEEGQEGLQAVWVRKAG